MKTKGKIVCSLVAMVLLLLLSLSSGYAAIPDTINYQGYLIDTVSGLPVNSAVAMTFSLYNVETGGTALWTENQTVSVIAGIYSVELGAVTPLTLPFDNPYWLGVKVGADPEMTPRFPLTSVGYAFSASNLLCTGCVTSSMIANGTILFADIAQNGCAANQGIRWNGTAWACSDVGGSITESDPQVGTLTANLWCRANAGATAIECNQAVPVTTETDPQVSTLTANLWCRSNAGGTAIDCTTAAPIIAETDPEVGALTANLWCHSNAGATAIVCDAAAPVAAEIDPQVGTLTSNLWCVSNAGGTAIDCTQAAPVAVEIDPQVGATTANLWCRANAGGTMVDCNQDAAALAAAHNHDATYVNVTGDSMGDLSAGSISASGVISGNINTHGVGVKPACDATTRGRLWFTDGVTGVGATTDALEVCAKDALDVYAWRALWP